MVIRKRCLLGLLALILAAAHSSAQDREITVINARLGVAKAPRFKSGS